MNYDGTTKVSNALATLYGYSPKSTAKAADIMTEARGSLGIGNARRLSTEQNMAIWNYHFDKLNGVNNPTDGNDSNIPTEAATDSDRNNPTTTKATEGAFRLINFSVKLGGKRTVISLEQYIVDALKGRFTLADNSQVRRWIELSMVDSFDAGAPIMRQVRFAIFQALIR